MRYSLATLLLLTGAVHGQDRQTLSLTGRIELANVNGRIDHFGADVRGKRLFVSALGNHTVEVLDVDSSKRLRTLTDLAEPQGVYYDPSTNRLFVACAKDGTTKLFDAGTFQLLETAKFSADADNIRYDARGHRVIVGYGDGALAFLDSNGRRPGRFRSMRIRSPFSLRKLGREFSSTCPVKRRFRLLTC